MTMDAFDDPVTLGPLDALRSVSERAHEALVERAVARRWSAGDYICVEGQPADWLCVIQRGEVAVSLERDGKRLVLSEIGPGRMLGELAFLQGAKRTADVTAISAEVVGRVLRFDDLDAVRGKYRVVDAVLMKVLHERVARLTRQYAELSFAVPGRERLRRHLLHLHWQRGGDIVWTTQKSLGEAICASRQSVNAWLRADVQRGWIDTVSEKSRYGVRILDPDALEAATRVV